mmetsp:Transcript_57712/g.175782  ORF Transcript_57712/g.175782 Transcript_57712/m.175782 type:complete len:269 (-) Transcript_57712:338-1144(-)
MRAPTVVGVVAPQHCAVPAVRSAGRGLRGACGALVRPPQRCWHKGSKRIQTIQWQDVQGGRIADAEELRRVTKAHVDTFPNGPLELGAAGRGTGAAQRVGRALPPASARGAARANGRPRFRAGFGQSVEGPEGAHGRCGWRCGRHFESGRSNAALPLAGGGRWEQQAAQRPPGRGGLGFVAGLVRCFLPRQRFDQDRRRPAFHRQRKGAGQIDGDEVGLGARPREAARGGAGREADAELEGRHHPQRRLRVRHSPRARTWSESCLQRR